MDAEDLSKAKASLDAIDELVGKKRLSALSQTRVNVVFYRQRNIGIRIKHPQIR